MHKRSNVFVISVLAIIKKYERTFDKIKTYLYHVQVFCAELPIFLREHKNGMYRTDVYFICKTLAEAPIFLAIPLIFTAIVYPMIGLYPNVNHFFIATAIVALVANVSTSFGNRKLTDIFASHCFFKIIKVLFLLQVIWYPASATMYLWPSPSVPQL